MFFLQLKFDGRDQIVDALTSWPGSLLYAAVAIGFLTMSVIEVFKRKYRYSYHVVKISDWLNHESESIRVFDSQEANNEPIMFRHYNKKIAIKELIKFSTAGDARAFYSLPIESLCGQMIVAVQAIVENPRDHSDILMGLLGKNGTEGTVQKDIENFIAYSEKFNEYKQDREYPDPRLNTYLEARNRIASYIQRNIDAFQINTTYAWRDRVRKFAFLIAFAISFVGSLLFAEHVPVITKWVAILLFGYVGGFLSSVFKDLLNVIQRRTK